MIKVSRALNGYANPRPRTKITSMNDAGAQVTSIYTTGVLSTPAAADFAGIMPVAPAQNNVFTDAGGTVIRNYQEYRMKSASLEYTPAVGTTTPGVVHLAYFDNPEIISKWVNGGYTTANKLTLAKTCPIRSSGPVWMQQSLAASMSARRPKFVVNTEIAALTVADYDMQVHGILVAVTEGVPFSLSFGILSLHYTVHGFHLQNAAISGI